MVSQIDIPLIDKTIIEDDNVNEIKDIIGELSQQIEYAIDETNINYRPYDLSTIMSVNQRFQIIRHMQSSIGPGQIYNEIQNLFNNIFNKIPYTFNHNNLDFLLGSPLLCFSYTFLSTIPFYGFQKTHGEKILSGLQSTITNIYSYLNNIELSIVIPTRFNQLWIIQMNIQGTIFPLCVIDYIQIKELNDDLQSYFSKKTQGMIYSFKELSPCPYDILIGLNKRAKSAAFNSIESLPEQIIKAIDFLFFTPDDILLFFQNYEKFVNKEYLYFEYFKFALLNAVVSKYGIVYSAETAFYKTLFEIPVTIPNSSNRPELLESIMDRICFINNKCSTSCSILMGGGKHLSYLRNLMNLLFKNDSYKNMILKVLKKIIVKDFSRPISSPSLIEDITLEEEDYNLYNFIIETKVLKPSSDADFGIIMKQGKNKYIGRIIATLLQNEIENVIRPFKDMVGIPSTSTTPIGNPPHEVSLCASHTIVNVYDFLLKAITLQNESKNIKKLSSENEDELKTIIDKLKLPNRIDGSSSPFDIVEKGDIESYLYDIFTNVLNKYNPDETYDIVLAIVYLSEFCIISNNGISSPLKAMFDLLYTIFIEENLINRIGKGKLNKEPGRIADCARVLLLDIIEKLIYHSDKTILIEYAYCLIDIIKLENAQIINVISMSQDLIPLSDDMEKVENNFQELYKKLQDFVNYIVQIATNDSLKGFLFHSNNRVESSSSSVIERMCWLPFINNDEILLQNIQSIIDISKPFTDFPLSYMNLPLNQRFVSRSFSYIDYNPYIENFITIANQDSSSLHVNIGNTFYEKCNKILKESSNINIAAKNVGNLIIPNIKYGYWLWYGINDTTFNIKELNTYHVRTENIDGLFFILQSLPELINPLIDLSLLVSPNPLLTTINTCIYNITTFFGLKNNTDRILKLMDLLHINNDQSIDEFKKILINGTKLTTSKQSLIRYSPIPSIQPEYKRLDISEIPITKEIKSIKVPETKKKTAIEKAEELKEKQKKEREERLTKRRQNNNGGGKNKTKKNKYKNYTKYIKKHTQKQRIIKNNKKTKKII